jgi:TPR repeat protein
MTLALEQLRKAAAQDHAAAINAVGWYEMEILHNNTAAAEYFHRAHELGNKDGSHNLGHMHLHGRYPGGEIDWVRKEMALVKSRKLALVTRSIDEVRRCGGFWCFLLFCIRFISGLTITFTILK